MKFEVVYESSPWFPFVAKIQTLDLAVYHKQTIPLFLFSIPGKRSTLQPKEEIGRSIMGTLSVMSLVGTGIVRRYWILGSSFVGWPSHLTHNMMLSTIRHLASFMF